MTIHKSIFEYTYNQETGKIVEVFNPDGVIKHSNLCIVDEYSMVPLDLYEHLLKYDTKILFLGDPFQLPAVGRNVNFKPAHFLTEVHRQALESPILRFATLVRKEKTLGPLVRGDEFSFLEGKDVNPALFTYADHLIVGYNNTRAVWNKRFRSILGFDSPLPHKGDKIICLKNNKDKMIFNGMIGHAAQKAGEGMYANCYDLKFESEGETYHCEHAWKGIFNGKKANDDTAPRYGHFFDYGYAITCHKSQGSEFDFVIAKLEPLGDTQEDKMRWVYTAATRASKRLIMVK